MKYERRLLRTALCTFTDNLPIHTDKWQGLFLNPRNAIYKDLFQCVLRLAAILAYPTNILWNYEVFYKNLTFSYPILANCRICFKYKNQLFKDSKHLRPAPNQTIRK